MSYYPRDLRGYADKPPFAAWPNDSAIALQFVVNYEEGGENCLLHGDSASEAFLSEIVGAAAWPDQRHWNMESIYEYGARAGFWRLHRLFTGADIPVTVYGVATALARSPAQVAAMQKANWEIASHGMKWIEHKDFTPGQERADIEKTIALHKAVTGERPRGWYTGRCSINTVDLISEIGGFEYVSDSYADDLPYWHHHKGKPQLVIPYTLDSNDMRFATPQGFNAGDQFFTYLKDSFDTLYAEGLEGAPKMLSIGLHCRLIGRPGRFAALKRFIEYAQSFDKVWFAKRIDIARHWHKKHPAPDISRLPASLSKEDFLRRFGNVFEYCVWIAERAFEAGIGFSHNTAEELHTAMKIQFRLANYQEHLDVLHAHPDLGMKVEQAEVLTPESASEQAGAGLDKLTLEEKEIFLQLNEDYKNRFGFPFIIAVKGLDKNQILDAFKTRINHSYEQEFDTACKQVEKIALLRLRALLP